jgi:2-amino-4-hydroxy-6-hydroxymethyldihydropteridine diphosphokinase
MEEALIGFGGNEGDSVQICRKAMSMLEEHPQIRTLAVSSLYRTKPVGPVEQNWFINGAMRCETTLEPIALLELLLEIEKRFGRLRHIHWGPRTLDLDILFYGERQIIDDRLTVPHPRLHERLFVLIPLAEIAPGWVHPGLGTTVGEILTRLLDENHDQEVQKLEAL